MRVLSLLLSYPDAALREQLPALLPALAEEGALSTARQAELQTLVTHLLRVDSLKTISADVPLGTPANKVYFAELSGDANIRATMENARMGEPLPNIPELGKFFPAMDAALEAITQGRQSPKDALDGAAARMLVK